jgi:hypothetical protein
MNFFLENAYVTAVHRIGSCEPKATSGPYLPPLALRSVSLKHSVAETHAEFFSGLLEERLEQICEAKSLQCSAGPTYNSRQIIVSPVPASARFAGAGNSPPRGKPASPGIAKGLVERVRNSRTAANRLKHLHFTVTRSDDNQVFALPAFLSSIFSSFTRHCTACSVKYISVLSAPPRTSKFRNSTLARK